MYSLPYSSWTLSTCEVSFFSYNVCFIDEKYRWLLLFPYPSHEKSMEKILSLWNGDIIPWYRFFYKKHRRLSGFLWNQDIFNRRKLQIPQRERPLVEFESSPLDTRLSKKKSVTVTVSCNSYLSLMHFTCKLPPPPSLIKQNISLFTRELVNI